MGQANEPAPIVEASHVLDTFATELSGVERLGCCVRFIVTAYQRNPSGENERIVVAKIILPFDAVPAAIRLTLKELLLPSLDIIGPANVIAY